ncbi:23S rRNA (pseudouridine(1915)-N(3))-methyltransferase RlmH [Devosia sp. PTR5]|uniref:Ribosomal RNA large subunit methyltransferase H n=1 Tax=Devosia oryzisoli TaxID=2774138 RepID=A0A927FVB9_9HYPH|nr:23S rRNA (pseudouridine(1915)-N(3))-methyltransferase RlmH [Devosia oryzisoli]MBD8066656.1 23S rRNA (pseudouridine(1915)-N(3))-methyltransferase RlmH [Devosia oryzisoli]
MRIAIGAIGRMKAGPERELVSRYLDRAASTGKPLALTGFEVSESAESRAGSAAARKLDEARALRAGAPDGLVVVLDERGKTLNSDAFTETLLRWRDAGRPAVTFMIGGADGLDPALVAEADLALSFSPMVWPHQLVRIMLAEQLYRATTILSGHPYHRGG